MPTKEDLRKKAKLIRNILYMTKISESITANFVNTEIYDAAEHIMLFYPKDKEVDMLSLTKDKTKNFYLPRMEGDSLVVCPYRRGDSLKTSAFGIQEPLTEPVSPEILDIIFMPALVASRNFVRVGYGKGFYDRFLNENQKILKAIRVVPIPSVLTIGTIQGEEHDAFFDILIDEL